jgi:NitT/TauT family transport system substrate-binding protein
MAGRRSAGTHQRRQVLGAALSGMVAAGLSSSLVAGPSPRPAIRLAFPGPPSTLSLPYFVAVKKGWLGDLRVQELFVTGDANVVRALLTADADIATVALINSFAAFRAGAKIRAISSWQPIADYYLIAAGGNGTTLRDLIGKTFAGAGAGNLSDQVPRLIMRKYGLDDSQVRFIQVGGHTARLQAVLGGRAQAALVNTLTAYKGVRDGRIAIVSEVAKELPNLGYVWNIVRADSLQDARLVAAFQVLISAGIRGARYVVEHPDEAALILSERLPGVDLDLLKVTVQRLNSQRVWGVNGGLEPGIEDATTRLAVELGTITAPVAPREILNSRFIDVALRDLGRFSE